MKIPEQTVSRPVSPESRGGSRPNNLDRFSRLLSKPENEREADPENPDLEQTEGLEAIAQPMPSASQLAAGSPILESSSETQTRGQIDKLAAEMLQQIQSFQAPDGTRNLDIQFNSKTLEGLHVHVEAKNGALGIQFSTKSEAIESLLSRSFGELQQALESRGIKVSRIGVSKPAASGASRYTRSGRGSQ